MTPSLSEISTPASASQLETQSNEINSNTETSEQIESFQESDLVEGSSISSPQLYTSPSLASEDSHLASETFNKDGVAMMTPPLENEESRLHPLLDEHHNGISTSTSQGANLHAIHTPLDAGYPDASNQYPSPSSGFVPPVTEDDFTLGEVPAVKSRQVGEQIDIAESSTAATMDQRGLVTVDEAEPNQFNSEKEDANAFISNKPISVQSLTSALLIPRRMSTSSSSSSLGDNHSQAISARSSPSTVAPQRRRSSTSQPIYGSTLASVDESTRHFIQLKIRDYAFTELDPRHVGARDVSAPSPRRNHHESDLQESETDEDEDVEGSFQGQELPTGLYHAAYEFVAESDHELSVQVGQKLRLIGHVDGGWAIVIRVKEGQEDVDFTEGDDTPNVDKGLVPEAYLQWVDQTAATPSS